jgi:hypothetical protein
MFANSLMGQPVPKQPCRFQACLGELTALAIRRNLVSSAQLARMARGIWKTYSNLKNVITKAGDEY